MLLLRNREDSYRRSKLALPIVFFLVVSTLGLFICLKGIQIPASFEQWQIAVCVLGGAAALSILAAIFVVPWMD